ncbi:hypothetical protein U4960_11100 [Altererythrobacter sp. H2]|uniref:hypothetical protein n=1 Tax=Altererythrobacter sp. H2 TaxID=3108391 RepID=UPI002B4C13B8|nr:hypothetical protein [Altererythrobacter sp. H2]WRK94844.1 hypothetical protein U4960_11100 [Altererythrobacter sp. H2]
MNRGKKTPVIEHEGCTIIASGGTSDGSDPKSGLWLHFMAGTDAGHETLRQAFARHGPELLSHDFGPVTGISDQSGELRPAFELLLDGLTYDACLTHVKRTKGGPVYESRPDILPRDMSAVALRLVPGPHLDGAPHSLPVVRGQFRLAMRLCTVLPGVLAAGWGPSASLVSREAFCALVAGWEKGGPIPSPGLVTFRSAMGHALQSRGLAFFTGQELRIEADLVTDPGYAARLGLRLAEMLIHRGRVFEAELFTGPSGEQVRIEPSANGRFVRAWSN